MVETKSPLTGFKCQRELSMYMRHVDHFREDIGQWSWTGFMEGSGFELGGELNTPELRLNRRETSQLVALAVSRIWEAEQFGYLEPLFGFNVEDTVHAPYGEEPEKRRFQITSVEGLWREASRLTTDDKVVRTLRNLAHLEENTGEGVALRFSFEPSPGHMSRDSLDVFRSPVGMAYGCVDSEIPLVMRRMRDLGWIERGDSAMPGTVIHITYDGYEEIRAWGQGRSQHNRSAFLICRFTDELEATYQNSYKPMGDGVDLSCPIKRVKDVYHVDKIDDKIMKMIREAAVVIVDLTDHNFNVAFEAGFALALNKPIVWAMKRCDGPLDLPFDIQTHNIIVYEDPGEEVFKERLRGQLGEALRRAMGGR